MLFQYSSYFECINSLYLLIIKYIVIFIFWILITRYLFKANECDSSYKKAIIINIPFLSISIIVRLFLFPLNYFLFILTSLLINIIIGIIVVMALYKLMFGESLRLITVILLIEHIIAFVIEILIAGLCYYWIT